MQGQAPPIFPAAHPLGVGREQGLHHFGPPPPHHRLVQGEVPHTVGRGGPGRLRPQQGVDGIPGHLEGARGVEVEVASVVRLPGLLGELGRLGLGEEGAVPLADKIGGGSAGGKDVACERKKMRCVLPHLCALTPDQRAQETISSFRFKLLKHMNET